MNDTQPRRARGAPFKDPSDRRSERLGAVQITAQQVDDYDMTAALEGKTRSQWVRETLDAQVRRTRLAQTGGVEYYVPPVSAQDIHDRVPDEMSHRQG